MKAIENAINDYFNELKSGFLRKLEEKFNYYKFVLNTNVFHNIKINKTKLHTIERKYFTQYSITESNRAFNKCVFHIFNDMQDYWKNDLCSLTMKVEPISDINLDKIKEAFNKSDIFVKNEEINGKSILCVLFKFDNINDPFYMILKLEDEKLAYLSFISSDKNERNIINVNWLTNTINMYLGHRVLNSFRHDIISSAKLKDDETCENFISFDSDSTPHFNMNNPTSIVIMRNFLQSYNRK